jgi:arginine deiminase
MLIVQAEEEAKSGVNNFKHIEHFMDALISHECIHVVIKRIEGIGASDSLDDVEVIVEHDGVKLQVTLNNMLFAKDKSGIVT